jgi:hypothetical protein
MTNGPARPRASRRKRCQKKLWNNDLDENSMQLKLTLHTNYNNYLY